MKVTVVMVSGKELVFECEEAEIQKSKFEQSPQALTLKGVQGQNFLFVRLGNVDAILYEEKVEK